jgi:hypothetical protein
MKIVTRVACVSIIMFSFISCHNSSMIVHDEMKAIEVANTNIKYLMNGLYQKAYELYDAEFKNQTTLSQFETFNKHNLNTLGKWGTAKFEYYLLIGAQPLIELIYTADFEKIKNVPVHFILTGNIARGYEIKVIDFGYNYKPFGEDNEKRPRLKIEEEIVIKNEPIQGSIRGQLHKFSQNAVLKGDRLFNLKSNLSPLFLPCPPTTSPL